MSNILSIRSLKVLVGFGYWCFRFFYKMLKLKISLFICVTLWVLSSRACMLGKTKDYKIKICCFSAKHCHSIKEKEHSSHSQLSLAIQNW